MWVDPREDGMAELRALLTAPDALRVYAALGEAGWAARCAERDARRAADARAAAGEPPVDHGPLPTLDQCRADALVDLLACAGLWAVGGGSPGPGWPRPGGARRPHRAARAGPRGQRPQILVTVPAGTLLGLGGEPAHLAGYGPIPDALARELAQDGVWRRVLTDPATGAVLDVGTRPARPARRPRAVRAGPRRACAGSPAAEGRPPAATSTTPSPYPEGETSAANLHALCRRHHRLKHEAGWQVARPARAAGWSGPAPSEPSTPPTHPTPATRPATRAGRRHGANEPAPGHRRASTAHPFEVALELAG